MCVGLTNASVKTANCGKNIERSELVPTCWVASGGSYSTGSLIGWPVIDLVRGFVILYLLVSRNLVCHTKGRTETGC